MFAVAGLVFYLIARLALRTPSRADLRLDQIRPESSVDAARAKPAFGNWTQALASQIPESEKEHRDFELLLRQAGMYAAGDLANDLCVAFRLAGAPLLIASVCAILADARYSLYIMLTGLAMAVILAIIPRLYVYFRRRRRMQRIRQALPDALDMLSMCVSGGARIGRKPGPGRKAPDRLSGVRP